MQFLNNWVRFEATDETIDATVQEYKKTTKGRDYAVLIDYDINAKASTEPLNPPEEMIFINVNQYQMGQIKLGDRYRFRCCDDEKGWFQVESAPDPTWTVHDEVMNARPENLLDITEEEMSTPDNRVHIDYDMESEEIARFLMAKLHKARDEVRMYTALLEGLGWKQ
jgi:hypothetical protein